MLTTIDGKPLTLAYACSILESAGFRVQRPLSWSAAESFWYRPLPTDIMCQCNDKPPQFGIYLWDLTSVGSPDPIGIEPEVQFEGADGIWHRYAPHGYSGELNLELISKIQSDMLFFVGLFGVKET